MGVKSGSSWVPGWISKRRQAREKAAREGKLMISNEKYVRGLAEWKERAAADDIWEVGDREQFEEEVSRDVLGVAPGSWERY